MQTILTQCESPGILPTYVARSSARFDADAVWDSSAAAKLGVALPDGVACAVMKRRVEYMAGRYCATEAVRSILPGFDSDIATGSGGAPCWPAGLVGSITHTHEFASAAVASASRARGIGIDTECVLTPSALRAVRRIGTRADDPAPSSLGLADEIYYALLFSSKESVFKCLHPLVRRMFDFQDVRIAFARELGTFQVTLLADLSCDLPIGFTIDGRWVVEEPLVHTGVVLQPL